MAAPFSVKGRLSCFAKTRQTNKFYDWGQASEKSLKVLDFIRVLLGAVN